MCLWAVWNKYAGGLWSLPFFFSFGEILYKAPVP